VFGALDPIAAVVPLGLPLIVRSAKVPHVVRAGASSLAAWNSVIPFEGCPRSTATPSSSTNEQQSPSRSSTVRFVAFVTRSLFAGRDR
jgi:hypothetical protein